MSDYDSESYYSDSVSLSLSNISSDSFDSNFSRVSNNSYYSHSPYFFDHSAKILYSSDNEILSDFEDFNSNPSSVQSFPSEQSFFIER